MSRAPDAALPSPDRRNGLWWSLQQIAQVLFTLLFRYQARGLEHVPSTGPALLLVNHQSYLDPLLLGLPMKRPVSMLARKNLFEIPLLGRIVKTLYGLPIDRESPGTGAIREILHRLDHGFLIAIFPEGTRSSGIKLGPIRPGFISILRRAEVPVIPVGIAGADRAMPRGSMLPRPRRLRVVFGEPVFPETIGHLKQRGREKQLLDFIRAKLQATANEAAAWLEGHRGP